MKQFMFHLLRHRRKWVINYHKFSQVKSDFDVLLFQYENRSLGYSMVHDVGLACFCVSARDGIGANSRVGGVYRLRL